jgi:hypothetical protein
MQVSNSGEGTVNHFHDHEHSFGCAVACLVELGQSWWTGGDPCVGIFHRVHVADSGSHTYLGRASSFFLIHARYSCDKWLTCQPAHNIQFIHVFCGTGGASKGQATAPPRPEKNFE